MSLPVEQQVKSQYPCREQFILLVFHSTFEKRLIDVRSLKCESQLLVFAGTASTVSSLTVTPRMAATAELQQSFTSVSSSGARLTPTALPLPDSSSASTPVTTLITPPLSGQLTSEPAVAPDDTVRQLEELFSNSNSLVFGDASAVADRVVVGQMMPLTEADILKTPAGIENNTIDSVTSLFTQKNATNRRGSSPYDTKIWPRPPNPPADQTGGDTDPTDDGQRLATTLLLMSCNW